MQEISQFLEAPTQKCLDAQKRLTNFIVATKDRGYTIKPDDPGGWDGKSNYVFTISGESDSEYAKDPSRRSVNSGATYLNNALIRLLCKMMPIIALSTSEAELYAAVLTAMDMMFAYYIVTQLSLNVKLPMLLYVDNKGAVDLANNWSVGGRTRHIGVKQSYLRELKETGYLQVLHKPGKDLVTDSGTKNVGTVEFWKQTSTYMS